MRNISFTILALLMQLNLLAQTKISELKPTEYFDFWIGEWELSWQNSDGTIGKGENHIFSTLSGKVIEENFRVSSDPNMSNFRGKSWSVYNQKDETWYQTWVDNQGAYLDFIGEIDGNKRIFKRVSVNTDGSTIQQRMVFYNISPSSFTWDWQNSTNKGKTWILRWRIEYKRK